MLQTVRCPRCHGETHEAMRWLEPAAASTSPGTIDSEAQRHAGRLFVAGACAHLTLMSWDAKHKLAGGWICATNPPVCEHGDAVMLPEDMFGTARCLKGHDVMLGTGPVAEHR